ncbi:MAG: DNA cytosine methyltransferase [Muribaculaceae bacterium]|nr:DNA cytosine methyltransferase [Muribaculaceae bacterium]
MDVVSFFAGCGGLDLGFKQAGFRVVWANEIEPYCRATYQRNHPATELIIGDICEVDPLSIPYCDGFIGGPPCQSWSVGGKQRGIEDKRGMLFLKYIELIKFHQPKFFVIENVKGMLDEKFKIIFANFVKNLENSGYNVQWSLLDAVNFRIPQNRERIFFIGFRKDLKVKYEFPKSTCNEAISLEKAIGDITEIPNFYPKKNSLKSKRVDNEGNVTRFYNHDVITSDFGPFYYRGNRRRGWNQPSFTINATAEFAPLHPSSPKMIYFGRENWNFQKDKLSDYRRMSVRECARIQTFPDNFIFEYEDIRNGYRMVGNAVPPRLGYEIAKSIKESFNNANNSDSAAGHKNIPIDNHVPDSLNTSVLVGYYKNDVHKRLILHNKIYYVRTDGRKGSIFKEDCQKSPRFLLLHHKDIAEIYSLEEKEPLLIHSSVLQSMGFKTNGETYLCFVLSDTEPRRIKHINGQWLTPKLDELNYSPFITTLEKVLK